MISGAREECPHCGSRAVLKSDHVRECYDCGYVWEIEDFRITDPEEDELGQD